VFRVKIGVKDRSRYSVRIVGSASLQFHDLLRSSVVLHRDGLKANEFLRRGGSPQPAFSSEAQCQAHRK